MDISPFLNSEFFIIAVIPVLIFLARIIDVSMGTLRIIFISRNLRALAAFFGFIEVLIWLLAISQIVKNLNNPVNYIAYAAGFGMGNFVGLTIERKLSMGNMVVRVVTRKGAADLIKFLDTERYAVTSIDAETGTVPVKIIFIVIKRKKLKKVVDAIEKFNPNAFYTVEDVNFVKERRIPLQFSLYKNFLKRFDRFFQKRK